MRWVFSLVVGMLVFTGNGCGMFVDGPWNENPHCVPMKECDPACATDGTEMCDPTTGNCIELKECDPACATDGSEYCDPMTGTCKATCDPQCGENQTCDDGTCKDLPVCDPACAWDEMCVE